MAYKIPKSETRSHAQIQEHYEIEKELAERLKSSSREDRQKLYSIVYDELFRRVLHHPMLRQRDDGRTRRMRTIRNHINYVKRYLTPQMTSVEIGPGDCLFSYEISKYVKKAYAIDVTKEAAVIDDAPINFELIIYDGSNIPLPGDSVGFAYSNQLMEHIHPDDAVAQLKSIHKVLSPAGIYICLTPNALNGPWDVSRYFDEVATGFHLKEYTYAELDGLFRSIGFSKTKAIIGGAGHFLTVPMSVVILLEKCLEVMPAGLRKYIANLLPMRAMLGIRILAVK